MKNNGKIVWEKVIYWKTTINIKNNIIFKFNYANKSSFFSIKFNHNQFLFLYRLTLK